MRYVVEENILSLGRDLRIEGEHNAVAYRAHGPAVKAREELRFDDARGAEQAYIKEPFLSDGKTFEVHRGGQRVAQLKEVTSASGPGVDIGLDAGGKMEARGQLANSDYVIRVPGLADIAAVTRRGTDGYHVDTVPNQDDVLLLASTIAIRIMAQRSQPA